LLGSFSFTILGVVFALTITTVFAAWNTTKNTGDTLIAQDWNDLVAEVSHPKLTTTPTCDASNEGRIRYNSTLKIMQYCDGANWAYMVATGNCGTFTDARDSKIYRTVQIGTQCWMRDNLNVGTRINGVQTPTNNATIEKYCYTDSESICTTDGALYTWDEAMAYNPTECNGGICQGICPSGWHIPKDSEQNTLDQFLTDGGQTCSASRNGAWDCNSAGTKLKSGGTSLFDGILAGYRSTDGSFALRGTAAYFWASSQLGGATAWFRGLNSTYATVYRYPSSKQLGFSLRCLKD
jgi:uncharacterized protein (TIGR02145 family)